MFFRLFDCSSVEIFIEGFAALTTPFRLPCGGVADRKSTDLIDFSSGEFRLLLSIFVANSFCAAATLSMASGVLASVPESSSLSLSCVIKPGLRCSLGNKSVTTDSFAFTRSSLSRDEALGTWLFTMNRQK